MFYEENEINELIICPYCKTKYNDPRLMECGDSFCMPCIEILINIGEKGFKCTECNDFHEMPPKGYLKNLKLAKLCEKRAVEVSRSKLADEFKAQLDEFKQNVDILRNKNKPCIEIIKEYFDNLRNEVQLSSEELIETIKKYNLDLIEHINAYETNSMLDFNKENKVEFDKFINEMDAFHTKWIEYFKQAKLDDNEMIAASNQADCYLEQIKKENKQFLVKLFKGDVLKFNKNSTQFKSSLVGSLVNADINYDFRERLINLNSHHIHNIISSFDRPIRPISVMLLCDGKIVLACREYNYGIAEIVVFDRNFNQLSKKKIYKDFDRDFELLQLNTMGNNTIILSLIKEKGLEGLESDNEEDYEKKQNLNIMKQLNVDLVKLIVISPNYSVSCVDTFDNLLYYLSGSGDKNKNKYVYVYDSQLFFFETYWRKKSSWSILYTEFNQQNASVREILCFIGRK